jgi:DNA-directed RNA polymerase specialized sigma subunit, sigma24 homolog
MDAHDADSASIKPLTKHKQSGEAYFRRPEVEEQIRRVLLLDTAEIFEIFQTGDRNAPDFLFDETIVYLLREARQKNNFADIEKLYLELNLRVARLLRKYYTFFINHADFEDFEQKIAMKILEKVFALESDSADYAQVNFGDFVIDLAVAERRGLFRRLKREQQLVFLDDTNDEDENRSAFELESGELSPEMKLSLREAMRLLPPDTQKIAALILDGWQIESKDKKMPTISRLLNVSSRTIRNRLKEAREILAGYQGEVR